MKRWLWLVPFLLLLLPFRADAQFVGSPSGIVVGSTTIAQLGTPAIGSLRVITNGGSATDCTIGGGSTLVLCWYDGSAWNTVGGGGATGWPTVITGAAATSESAPIKIYGQGGQAAFGAALFQHSSGTFFWECVVAAGQNNCDYYRQLDAGFNSGVKDSGGNIIFRVNEAAGWTAFNDEKHFRVATCQNATASLVFDHNTTNFPASVCEGTTTRLATADFDDATDEFIHDSWTLPASYQGTINVHFNWKGASITNEVRWCVQLVRVPDGATSDPAQGTASCVEDTAKGTTLQENVATVSAVANCASCVAGDRINVVISRDANHANDDFVGDAKLITYGRTIR